MGTAEVEGEAYFDLTEVDRALADVELRGKRMAPAFREARKPLRQDQRAHARAEQGPDGAWPARAAVTEARRRSRNRRVRKTRAIATYSPRQKGVARKRSAPKRLLGRLPGAILVVAADLFVRATSRAGAMGAAHQYGARVGHGRRVKLRARRFLWLSDELIGTVRDILIAHVVKGWKR